MKISTANVSRINTLSAAKEVALALAHLSASEKRKFLEDLNETMTEVADIAAAKEQKLTRVMSVRAARAKAGVDLPTKNTLGWLDGLLRRHGCATLEEIAEAGPGKIDSMLASAQRKLSLEDKLALKSGLHHLGSPNQQISFSPPRSLTFATTRFGRKSPAVISSRGSVFWSLSSSSCDSPVVAASASFRKSRLVGRGMNRKLWPAAAASKGRFILSAPPRGRGVAGLRFLLAGGAALSHIHLEIQI
jgi:hypothetical protein